MNYANAPIKEAVFDIRVNRLNLSHIDSLLLIKEKISDQFSTEKVIQHNIVQLNPNPSQNEYKQENLGYIFLNNDESRQLQLRMDGFTFNVLKPYENWENHFEVFMKFWNIYNNLFKPTTIQRIAARYINRIELPSNLNNFQDYIVNMPPIPESLPQLYNNFFMQIQVPCEDSNTRNAIINETIEPVYNEILPFILDIDVFQTIDLENTEESLRKNFSEIKDIKNKIFESCITEKTRKLFN